MATKTKDVAPDYLHEARVALDEWDQRVIDEAWTMKVVTLRALFALLWAILHEVRALRAGRE